MSEMVERVVQALRDREQNLMIAAHGGPVEFEGMVEGMVEDLARAAIAAMREPSESMVQAARTSAPFDRDVTETWPLMIDAALK